MTTFRLLHMSDTHFCVVPNRHNIIELRKCPAQLTLNHFQGKGRISLFPSSHDPALAEGAARFLFQNKHSIDAVAITGDLATTGRPEDLDVALAYVSAYSNTYFINGHPTIGFCADRLLILPGNHDRYQGIFGRPGSTNFDSKFASQWPAMRSAVVRKVFEKEGKKLALIAADFTLFDVSDADPCTPPNWLGQGKVHIKTLEALESKTTSTKSEFDDVEIIWLVHFPPLDDCCPSLRLIDKDLLLNAAHRHQIGLILSGHLHQTLSHTSEYGTITVCASSACSCEDIHNCSLHLIEMHIDEGAVLVERRNLRWDDGAGDFLLDE